MAILEEDLKNYLIYKREVKKRDNKIIYPITGGWFPLGDIYLPAAENEKEESLVFNYGIFYYDNMQVNLSDRYVAGGAFIFPCTAYFRNWLLYHDVAYSNLANSLSGRLFKDSSSNDIKQAYGINGDDEFPQDCEKLMKRIARHLLNRDYPISFYDKKIQYHLDFLATTNLLKLLSPERYVNFYNYLMPESSYAIIRETVNHYNDTDYAFMIVSEKIIYARQYTFHYYCNFHRVNHFMQLDILAAAVSYEGNFIYMVTDQDMDISHCSLFPTVESGEIHELKMAIMQYLESLHNPISMAAKGESLAVSAGQPENYTEADLKRSLDSLIGLDEAKKVILQQFKLMQVENKRRAMGLPISNGSTRHMLFTGNPGTGKTMVARIMAEMFKGLGILGKDSPFIEASRGDLVAEYIGQTAPKMRKVFESARGGILFIDEAYSLYSGAGSNDFGKEAIDELMKLMEDYKDDTIVILAGYTSEMNKLLTMNPGLKSRIPIHIDFPDYTPHELGLIAKRMLAEKQFIASDDVIQKMENTLGKLNVGESAGNARLVRNFVEKMISNQAMRISDGNCTKEDLMTILPEDIPGYSDESQDTDFDLDEEFQNIIGLAAVKTRIKQLEAEIRIRKIRERKGLKVDSTNTLHFIFSGNPGTGKTTMARVMARLFHKLKIIPSNNLVEVSRKDLVAGYVGQTAAKTEAVFNSASGGVLFIDEAYSLTSANEQDFGHEAIDTLVKLIEDNQSTVVILAGYTDDMRHFLDSNPGLASRFPDWIEFPDYNEEELLEIGRRICREKGYILSREAEEKVRELMARERLKPNFGNGRVVRNCIEKSIAKQNMRILEIDEADMTEEDLVNLTGDDMTL